MSDRLLLKKGSAAWSYLWAGDGWMDAWMDGGRDWLDKCVHGRSGQGGLYRYKISVLVFSTYLVGISTSILRGE